LIITIIAVRVFLVDNCYNCIWIDRLGGSVVGKVAGRAIKSGIKNSAKTVAGEVKNKGIWTKTKQKSRVDSYND
jgi:outer membrane lipoprotein SlyB